MAYTSITITRIGQRSWQFTDNVNVSPISRNKYTGGRFGDYFNFKASGGEILYTDVPWSIIDYVDNVDETTFTPTSAEELFVFLNELDSFFLDSYDSSGGGVITEYTVLEAEDVNIATLAGQAGKAFVVNNTGTKFVLATIGGVTSITGLTEWVTGDVLLPNKFLGTNSTGTKIIQGDIELVVNTPIAVDEFRVVAKGTQGGVPNIEQYVKEIGDRCAGVSSIDGKYYSNLEYNGGDPTDLANYTIKYFDEAVN